MTVDRYTKAVLTVIALALVALAARPLLPALTPAAVSAETATPKYEVAIPKSWGKYLAYSNNNLLLEGPDGWRIVDVEGKAPEYPKIKVLIHWQ